jgi:NADH pyrophosphatase NudC (nudix superfamily)
MDNNTITTGTVTITTTTEKWRFCAACGHKAKPAYSYCPSCGQLIGTLDGQWRYASPYIYPFYWPYQYPVVPPSTSDPQITWTSYGFSA